MYIMQKDFDSWNEKKKELSQKERTIFFKEGEIWWVSIGINIGEEVYGKGNFFSRPVIVFHKLSSSACLVIPLTTKERVGSWYHVFELDGMVRYAMMHQIKMMSTKRFESRMTTIPEPQFNILKKAVAQLLGFS